MHREHQQTMQNFEENRVNELCEIEQRNKQIIDKLRHKVNEKEDLVIQIQQENLLLRSQFDLLDKGNKNSHRDEARDFRERYNKLNDSYKELEKKYITLVTDLDLKEMQIRSQDNMINRRGNEINEMRSRLDTSFNNTSIVKFVNSERER
jgi:predicted nuclease with TOPRIM domain